jgi:hypothetical protein
MLLFSIKAPIRYKNYHKSSFYELLGFCSGTVEVSIPLGCDAASPHARGTRRHIPEERFTTS